MTHFVRTTIQPHKEIEVGDAEFTDLSRAGLIYQPPAPEPPKTKRSSRSTEEE